MSVAEALIAQPSPHLLSIATHKKCTLAESPREGGRRWRKVATDAFYECNFLIAHCEAIIIGMFRRARKQKILNFNFPAARVQLY